MKFKKLALATTLIVIAVLLATWLVHRPRKITQEFAGHIFHERYEEAALMLQAPSAIDVSPDSELILIDQDGNSTTVPATKLPFKVGGGKLDSPSDFSMTALGKSMNGVLAAPPVIIYLSIDGSKVRIDRVDS